MTIETVQSISLDAWDKLVEKTYGRVYAFQQQDGCKARGTRKITVPVENPDDFPNDDLPEIINSDQLGVSFKAWLARDPKQVVLDEDEDYTKLFWERNFYPSLDMVVNDLHAKGLLPAGKYVINIDW